MVDPTEVVLAASNLVVGAGAYLAGRRGRAATATRDEAAAADALSTTVVRLDAAMAEQRARLEQAELRATAAEKRAAAAELRAATAEAALLRLQAEVSDLRAELARYEVAVPPPS